MGRLEVHNWVWLDLLTYKQVKQIPNQHFGTTYINKVQYESNLELGRIWVGCVSLDSLGIL